jgi:DNA-binding transcriptional regulator YiaG
VSEDIGAASSPVRAGVAGRAQGRGAGQSGTDQAGLSDAAPFPVACRSGAASRLGVELRKLRLELGISQRRLTRLIGLSAHSNLGDYERGRRIPPSDIVAACERLLGVQPGYLQQLRSLALRERARAQSEAYYREFGG